MKQPHGARLLGDRECPQPGDFWQWSDRDEWFAIKANDVITHSLPVATARVRHGQPSLKFATFRPCA